MSDGYYPHEEQEGKADMDLCPCCQDADVIVGTLCSSCASVLAADGFTIADWFAGKVGGDSLRAQRGRRTLIEFWVSIDANYKIDGVQVGAIGFGATYKAPNIHEAIDNAIGAFVRGIADENEVPTSRISLYDIHLDVSGMILGS